MDPRSKCRAIKHSEDSTSVNIHVLWLSNDMFDMKPKETHLKGKNNKLEFIKM